MLYVFIILLILISLALWENLAHRRRLESIPIRILVNGTRGKTSVSRILAEALNEKGIRTLCRTTGSAAEILYPDGNVEPFKRMRGRAKLTELIPFVRLAGMEKAECIVVECMALNPENQKTISEKLIKPTHIIITNAYQDHVAEMGPEEEDTVKALSASIIRGAKVYSPDSRFNLPGTSFTLTEDAFAKRNDCPAHTMNLSLVHAVGKEFGIDENDVIRAAVAAKADIGLHKSFQGRGGALVLPHFSVNDLTCMTSEIIKMKDSGKTLYLVFNNRRDREYRIPLFSDAVNKSKAKVETVYAIGDYPKKVARYLKKHSALDAKAVPDAEELVKIMDEAGPESVFLCLGNIKGAGEIVVSRFLDREN